MTRKDYVLIAAAIRSQVTHAVTSKEHQAQFDIAAAIAKALAQDNLRFDGDRFLKACGF